MKRSTLTVTLIAGLVAVGIAGYLSLIERSVTLQELGRDDASNLVVYRAPAYSLSFSYPPTYYLKEREDGPGARPELSLVLVENTEENIAVLEGRSEVPREGPPAITIDVYPNPNALPAEDWVNADTNWTVRTSEAAPMGAGQITGVTYSWSGLYEGRSVIVTSGTRAYVFAVTWMSPEDALVHDFEHLLESVIIAP